MPIAKSIKTYLEKHDVDYDLIKHPRTQSSMKTAQSARIPGGLLAKAVILRDERDYLMAILPSTHHLDLDMINLHQDRDMELVSEEDISCLFSDCEPGALPPIGPAYDIETILDEALTGLPDIYFEAGDHRELIHVSGDAFRKLQEKCECERFSYHI